MTARRIPIWIVRRGKNGQSTAAELKCHGIMFAALEDGGRETGRREDGATSAPRPRTGQRSRWGRCVKRLPAAAGRP